MLKKNILNLVSLTAIQGSNAVLPIIVFPYVLKTIGSDLYSRVAISEALMFIVYAFVLYSFDINGVSEIVRLKNKTKKDISKIFIKITVIRLIIFSTFTIFIYIVNIFINSLSLYLLMIWMLLPLSYILQSSYFFQALEENLFLSVFVFISRALCIILIFVFINSGNDVYLVPLIIGSSYLFGGICSFIYIIYKYKISFQKITIQEIKKSFYDGKEIFSGNISVLLFRGSNIFILEFLTSNSIFISAYSISEKIIKSIQALSNPVNQYLFPKIIQKLTDTNGASFDTLKLISKQSIIQFIWIFIIFTTLFFTMIPFKKELSHLINFKDIDLIYQLIFIMSPAILFGTANFIFGSIGLNHLNERYYYAKSVIFTGFASIFISFMLIYLFGIHGASVSYLLGEIILFLLIMKKFCLR